MPAESAFDRAHAALDAALASSFRREVIAAACAAAPMTRAATVLRRGMQTHLWNAGPTTIDLRAIVTDFDRRTRAEGFHVLNDWDGKADAVMPTTIAGDVLDYVVAARADEAPDPLALAVLLDYYFLYLLALVATRVWEDEAARDGAAAGARLDRVTALVAALQGPQGSGHCFVDHAESLLLLASSHYERNEGGFDLMLTRSRDLPWPNQVALALVHAQALGSHLRFGYEVTYGRDLVAMQDDNAADYPWSCYALGVLAREYGRMEAAGEIGPARDRVVEAILNGLSPDVAAFLDRPPASIASQAADRADLAAILATHHAALVAAFGRLRPLDREYSPLSLFFNFSQNVVKGAVVDAGLVGEPWALGLNDLLTGGPQGDPRSAGKMTLARTLMGYARARPDTIRGRLSPVIVCDPVAGRRFFATVMKGLERWRA